MWPLWAQLAGWGDWGVSLTLPAQPVPGPLSMTNTLLMSRAAGERLWQKISMQNAHGRTEKRIEEKRKPKKKSLKFGASRGKQGEAASASDVEAALSLIYSEYNCSFHTL